MQTSLLKGDSIIRKELGKENTAVCRPAELYNYKHSQTVLKIIDRLVPANSSNDITNQQIIEELAGDVRKIDDAKHAAGRI